MKTLTEKKAREMFEEIKGRYPGFLSPSDQQYLMGQFAERVMMYFKKDNLEDIEEDSK